jgi:hypothetical protein
MAKKKRSSKDPDLLANVTDYRHETATRVNIPPAKIAVKGVLDKELAFLERDRSTK